MQSGAAGARGGADPEPAVERPADRPLVRRDDMNPGGKPADVAIRHPIAGAAIGQHGGCAAIAGHIGGELVQFGRAPGLRAMGTSVERLVVAVEPHMAAVADRAQTQVEATVS